MLEKIKAFGTQYYKILLTVWIGLGFMGIFALFSNDLTLVSNDLPLAGIFLLVSGVAGFAPRLISSGIGSAVGMALMYSSLVIGQIFGLLPQILALGLGIAFSFKLINLKGDQS